MSEQEAELRPRITTPYLTKYERARVLGTRGMQISLGAPVTIDAGDLTDPIAIAEKELEAGQLPLIIRRYLPNHEYEDVAVKYLII
ncbi:DNA-directed RNA polymerases I, II, and III 14.4 kDa polypeptide, putative [Trichomonas vaginalis G3]|uniref:DNA-directed RNA polymerases I, II, and III 14.4 kDa polypeptide, putative n=1 Tax=Trichomonas vaginalis (strain ATCC PRA-98 / G3) TaxID=412133 RepID=A2FZ94_TRIV3|nr:DNA-directed 5'-3' RNA polymerase protein [Trichomonas vaginalis G3]EAX89763.1 DNA-directed RNA polymerases I, II, and III 14.4 kDa polypeptide, putative [Trichomonas vaginalis G3]KAI5492227.1 DNA-directed 5'-3' RNA polymerase protein [Trichomonas vaginalis G3]|eukprot:XP_001302693.1 DNA-directed RNA polymerases I, II, and III 14.4 kDa polypeptide [Trichomonas vaginalis G3]